MSKIQDSYTVFGTRPPRFDAADKVTGRALYGPDINLPGMLHGKVLRSPHAHARILSIDTSRAQALPGVYAVVTAQDLPSTVREGINHTRDNILASDKVLYVGHPIAAVAASDPHIAEQAVTLIDVEYEVLPAVVDVLDAAQEGAPLLHEQMTTRSLAGTSARPSNVAATFSTSKATRNAALPKPTSSSSASFARRPCTRATSNRTRPPPLGARTMR